MSTDVASEELPALAPLPWKVGDDVTGRHCMADVLKALHFGRQDEGYVIIGQKFTKRKIITVEDLTNYKGMEIVSMLRDVDGLKYHPRAYVAAIGTAIKHDFFAAVKTEGGNVKAGHASGQGSNWNSNCSKKTPSADFNPYKYAPDGRVYAGLPARGDQDELDDEKDDNSEALVVDYIWIDAQANPQPAETMGDYLPSVSRHTLLPLLPLPLLPLPTHCARVLTGPSQPPREVTQTAPPAVLEVTEAE